MQGGSDVGGIADLEALQGGVERERRQEQGTKKGRAEWPAPE